MSDPEGDVLNSYIEMGAKWERAAIVAMLRNPIWADMPALLISDHIERGEHTWPDVE